ncbi:hypothetical protein ACF0H5_000094 [Mactra antiquata]
MERMDCSKDVSVRALACILVQSSWNMFFVMLFKEIEPPMKAVTDPDIRETSEADFIKDVSDLIEGFEKTHTPEHSTLVGDHKGLGARPKKREHRQYYVPPAQRNRGNVSPSPNPNDLPNEEHRRDRVGHMDPDMEALQSTSSLTLKKFKNVSSSKEFRYVGNKKHFSFNLDILDKSPKLS